MRRGDEANDTMDTETKTSNSKEEGCSKIRKIYWYCPDKPDSDEFTGALQELSNNLRKFPIRIEVVIEKLPGELRQKVCKQLQKTRSFSKTSAEIGDILCKGPGYIPGLLIFCRLNSAIAKVARDGFESSNKISLVYLKCRAGDLRRLQRPWTQ